MTLLFIFQSKEFADFLEYLGIQHKKGIPLSPESNGEVERFNRTLLKTARTSQAESKEWKLAIKDFLFQYRSTPHGVTGETPAKLLMGRELKTKIPHISVKQEITEQVVKTRYDNRSKNYCETHENAKTCESRKKKKVH